MIKINFNFNISNEFVMIGDNRHVGERWEFGLEYGMFGCDWQGTSVVILCDLTYLFRGFKSGIFPFNCILFLI